MINKSALVPYSATQMFDLVDDIDAYAEFLPWCRTSTVLSRGENEVTASLEIAHSGLNKSFTTRNLNETGTKITMQLVEGPFKKLEGVWQFEQLGDKGCKVSLVLDFEFSNKLVGMTFGSIFGQMAGTLVDAFTQRATQVYG
ncbi:MAG: type II toxin-antitoxin system RatA family toxin [Gammaproteobacteria bacterium]|nr:type II toxin-antitoxin system RatA family toxin [Gammaproteobacteria bacterium]